MQEIVQSVDLSFIVQSLFRSKQEIHYEENYQMDSRKGVFRVEFDRVQILSSISGEEDFQFVNGREIPHVTFEEIIGAEDAKNELKKVLDYLKNARAYRRLGWRIPRGILLDGAPGTGKTMLAKALANQAQLPFIQKNAGEFLHKWAGEGPKRVRELFRTARKYAPSIIFIDEFDIIARNRNSLGEGSEHLHEITNAFLSEMDGFLDYDQPVYVIAATNFSTQKEKTRLDEAFLRRFDAKIHIPLPNASERALFLNQMVQKYHLEAISENEIQNIADRSDEWNLADLSLVVQNALRKASEHGNVQSISDLDLDEAFESFRYGSAQAESIEQLTKVAYHEAGHTLVAYLVGEIPDYVTILSRGDYGKYMRIGQEDKMTFSRRDCLNRICISLSGRAAECLIDPNEGINTGSRLDLSRATSVAMDMIWKCGMGESLISYETLPNPLSDPFIREKVNRILNDQYQRAMHLLAENKSTFDKLVRQLLEKKQLNHFELKALFQENKCR